MASPNHKAGLAVVVPTSDNRSPTQRKSKQHALNVPRNRLSQLNGTTPPRLINVSIPSQQSNAVSPPREPNGAPFRHQSTGQAPFHPSNRIFPSQPRLLSVDEALQFSPFSSVVPFSPGERCWNSSTAPSDSSRYNTNTKCQPPWLSTNFFHLKRASCFAPVT